jgi:nicotinate-nucleotide adenylyltransferase
LARVGVFGGTFDPIHFGHLAAANEARYQLGLDKVLFVPAGDPWQKTRTITPSAHRCAMVEAAIAGNPYFSLSMIDVQRQGPTYTVDTLRELKTAGDELFFILGADALHGLPTWHNAEQLGDLATFVAFPRPGEPEPEIPKVGVDVVMISMPGVAVSSTQIRQRALAGAPLEYLTPDVVVRYIAEHGIYREEIHD